MWCNSTISNGWYPLQSKSLIIMEEVEEVEVIGEEKQGNKFLEFLKYCK